MTIKPSSIVIFEIKHASVVPGGGHVLARTEVTLKSLQEMENESDAGGSEYTPRLFLDAQLTRLS